MYEIRVYCLDVFEVGYVVQCMRHDMCEKWNRYGVGCLGAATLALALEAFRDDSGVFTA